MPTKKAQRPQSSITRAKCWVPSWRRWIGQPIARSEKSSSTASERVPAQRQRQAGRPNSRSVDHRPGSLVEGRGAQHGHGEAGARIDPVGQAAAAVELDDQLDAAAIVGQQHVGAGAVRQPGVQLDPGDGGVQRPPRLLAASLAATQQLGGLILPLQPGIDDLSERALGRRHVTRKRLPCHGRDTAV